MAIDYNNPASFDNSPAMQQEFIANHSISKQEFEDMVKEYNGGVMTGILPLVHSLADIAAIVAGADPTKKFFAFGGDSNIPGQADVFIELIDVNTKLMSDGSTPLGYFGIPFIQGLANSSNGILTFEFFKAAYKENGIDVVSIAFKALKVGGNVLYFDRADGPAPRLI